MSDILKRIKAYSGFIGFFSGIIMLAFVFHYPIQILDALSSEPVPGFDIKISVWRVIFEPFIGLLLFYLRADQPFLEFTVLLIWIISLLLIIPVVSTLLKKGRRALSTIKHKFLKWLTIIPLILSIWSGLLLLIIFAILPSNTIVNNLDNTILINLTAIQNTVMTALYPRQVFRNGINATGSMLFLSQTIIIMRRHLKP
jgi:hypothetical protein